MKTSEVEWLLRGKLFCGHCGTQMTGDSGTGRANRETLLLYLPQA